MNVKTMAISVIAAMMIVAIFGMNGAMAAGQDAYGTQVVMCDVDDTYRLNPLLPIGGHRIMWAEAIPPGPPGYDQQDYVYLDVDGANFFVAPLDIRLTPVIMQDQITGVWVTYPAGSQVQVADLDFNVALLAPPTGRGGVRDVMFRDIPPPIGLYDLNEPVYIDMDAPGPGFGVISINDVRLTGPQAGAKVLGTDPDVNNLLFAMPNIANGADLTPCRYYDVDGNGIYDAGDNVIFDATITPLVPPPAGLGSVNGIRLTPFNDCGVTYPYGSKIRAPDADCVQTLGTLNPDPPFVIRFRSPLPDGYTVDDAVYIDLAGGFGNLLTSPGDVRLTPFGANPAGSQIILATDPDAGAVLIPLPAGAGGITFFDLNGDQYTPDDPVYVDIMGANTVSINDVILSAGVPNSGAGAPGTKVTAASLYLNQPLQAIPAGAIINYFDTNGDGWFAPPPFGLVPPFGVGDFVFLDVGPQGFVSANDVVLTEQTFGLPFGSKVVPTDGCCVDGLTVFPPAGAGLVSWDITADGFSDDDPVYITTAPPFPPVNVQANDVRLTPVTVGAQTYAAGTVVRQGDADQFQVTNWIPWNLIRYHNIAGPGYTPGEPVIIDSDNGGTITPLDVRLTPYATFAAGSKVILGDGDPYINLALTPLPGLAARVGFFDVNGRVYDGNDYVYLDLFGDGFVTVNDIRLTGTCLGDLNGDGFVNINDVLVIINAWGPCAGCPEDLNGDGFVNVNDVLVIVNNWGPCP